MPVDQASLALYPDAKNGSSGPAAITYAVGGEFTLPDVSDAVTGAANVEVTLFCAGPGNTSTNESIGMDSLPVIIEEEGLSTLTLAINSQDMQTQSSGDGFESDDDDNEEDQ